MKRVILLIVLFFSLKCYSQKIFVSVVPNWDNYSYKIIASEKINADSVFYYKNKNDNKDSSLIMAQYFDSLGDLIERDEYDFKGEVVKITNNIYSDTLLLKQESIEKQFFYANEGNITKKIFYYNYDSLGNRISIKENSFFGDSLKYHSINELSREYDSLKYLQREFIVSQDGVWHLHHSYDYLNGNLSEIKIFDSDGDWMYSYLYEYNEQLNSKIVYKYDDIKHLSSELFYDNHNQLIVEKHYTTWRSFLDHSTQTFSFYSNGLAQAQTYQDLNGKYYYYKHFYSK